MFYKLLVIAVLVISCEENSPQDIQNIYSERAIKAAQGINYVKDHKRNLCYGIYAAESQYAFGFEISCDKVKGFLVN